MFHIDNIYLGPEVESDIAVKMETPSIMHVNKQSRLKAVVENRGRKAAESAILEILLGDEVIRSIDIDRLEAGTTLKQNIRLTPTVLWPDKAAFTARLVFDDDNEANNTYACNTIPVVHNQMPAPTSLSGSRLDEVTSLNWSAPESPEFLTLTDGAELYRAFSTGLPGSKVENDMVGDWTMIDRDPGTNGTESIYDSAVGNLTYPNAGMAHSFFIWNNARTNAPVPSRSGHNGSDQCFISTADKDGQTDDWMISPKLSGNGQTIKFFAGSFSEAWKEPFEVLYTTAESLNPDDYTLLAAVEDAGYGWNEFQYTLPEGAKHFAIRGTGKGSLALVVDDITYEGVNPYIGDVTGYNIYRDGQCIGFVDAPATTFDDTTDKTGTYTYYVTAVYSLGESDATNVFVSEPCEAIAGISAENITATGGNGEILIANAAGLGCRVYNPAGSMVKAVSRLGDNACIGIAPGIYLVSVGSKTFKVIVR